MRKYCVALLPLLFAISGIALAASKVTDGKSVVIDPGLGQTLEMQPLESIQSAVEDFIYDQSDNQDLTVVVKMPDSRLRLARCATPLAPAWANRSRKLGRVTVQVACTSPKPWRVHVQASVTRDGMVWILKRGVQRDEILSRDLLVEKEVTLGANNGSFNTLGTPIVNVAPWLGFAFTQRVNGGKVLNERMLKPARIIRKGDAVVIRYQSKGLQLQTRGVALSDAASDQQLQVRNSASGKVIDVVVVSHGAVKVIQ